MKTCHNCGCVLGETWIDTGKEIYLHLTVEDCVRAMGLRLASICDRFEEEQFADALSNKAEEIEFSGFFDGK
jgi:hypothetical protein